MIAQNVQKVQKRKKKKLTKMAKSPVQKNQYMLHLLYEPDHVVPNLGIFIRVLPCLIILYITS